uniref:Nucleolar protein 9 n=1 Tax=Acrobeloides nanus TaxID=290746 RepID=A0A914CRP9_9BILA
MTNFEKKRKRKHADFEEDNQQSVDSNREGPSYLQRLNPYGTFPKKSTANSNFKRPDETGEDFVRKWPINNNNGLDAPQWLKEESGPKPVNVEKNMFPTDLVSYLRQIVAGIPASGKLDRLIIERCLEECNGEETNLLGYQESSRLVETIFSSSRFGAFEFLKKLNRAKRKKRADLLFQGVSAHTIESLLLALMPLEANHNEVISEWMETIIDSWNDLVMDRSASHVIRSFAALLLGISQSKGKDESKKPQEEGPKFSNPEMAVVLRQEFLKIVNLALDFTSMKDYMSRPTISLLMQDIIHLDSHVRSGKVAEFVMKSLESPDFIEKSFQGRETSRIWERIIMAIDDDTRETLYNALSGQVTTLATHVYAHFPMAKLISVANSEEMVTDICDELFPLTPNFVADHKHYVLSALIKCASKKADAQTTLLKGLKNAFHCGKKATSMYFVPQVLCMNNVEMLDADENDGSVRFDVNRSTVPGSCLLRDLLHLSCHKNVLKSFLSIHPENLQQMAIHQVASHVIDNFFTSPTIDTKTTYIFRIMANKLEVKAFRRDKAKWMRDFEVKLKQKKQQANQTGSKSTKTKRKRNKKNRQMKEEITIDDE